MRTAAGPRCGSTCPPRPYRLLWLELAERQYLDLSDDTRALLDQRLTLLESDPAGLPHANYDAAAAGFVLGEQAVAFALLLHAQQVLPQAAVAAVIALVETVRGRNERPQSAHREGAWRG